MTHARVRVVAVAVLIAALLVGGIALALRVTMSGSGSHGPVLSGWSILESCTPAMPGDSRGSVGSASYTAKATATSRFVADNEVLLETGNGSFRGRISEVSLDARVDVSVAGPHQFLNVDKIVPPVYGMTPSTDVSVIRRTEIYTRAHTAGIGSTRRQGF